MASSTSPDGYAVIGAGYGDEGKGRVTDALSSPRTRVVRFNGGAQAGHTVCAPNRNRHVFHHFGAGTFAGASTHLSRFFVVNPILAEREMAELGFPDLSLSIDPRAPVTTPIDMMMNQAVETKRGAARHGSCGLGFGETIERTEQGLPFTFNDLVSLERSARLAAISDLWMPERCRQLGLDPADLPYHRDIDNAFLDDCYRLTQWAEFRLDDKIDKDVDRVVFEGAQGLGLDQSLGTFPHVTRSFTGLTNALTLADEAGITTVHAVYVTRTYATRHGAGPLSREDEWDGPAAGDPTNVENQWQGALRCAPLDVDERRRWRELDARSNAHRKATVYPGLFVTCLDQAPGCGIPFDPMDYARQIADGLNLPLWGTSDGPGRDACRWHFEHAA